MSPAVVVDASVAIKLFLEEDLSDEARQFFAACLLDTSPEPSHDLYAPAFMWAECANVLWKYVSFYGYPQQDAQADLRDLLELRINAVPSSDLLGIDAFHLACEYRLTVYDACYLALARSLSCMFVTADEKLVALAGDQLPVVRLAEWARSLSA